MARSHNPLKPQWYHVLVALSDGEKHGASIMRDVLDQTAGNMKLWPATLYGALEHLTEEGLTAELSSAGRHPAGESERKRYYRITRAGRRAVELETERLESIAKHARLKLGARSL